MKADALNRLKARRDAKAERDKLRREAYAGLKGRFTAVQAKPIADDMKRRVKAKIPPPPPATAAQVEKIGKKLAEMGQIKQEVPEVKIPEPKVVVERAEPDSVLRSKIGEIASVNREMSRSMEQMVELLRNREAEVEVEITGRDKRGNIKTIQVRRI